MCSSSTRLASTARDTKYCRAILVYLQKTGHATNALILSALQKDFPNLSATTVHRATARLCERGSLRLAPPDQQGAIRYDANVSEHDHFTCSNCNRLGDVVIADSVRRSIESQLDGCRISGSLVIQGICKHCRKA